MQETNRIRKDEVREIKRRKTNRCSRGIGLMCRLRRCKTNLCTETGFSQSTNQQTLPHETAVYKCAFDRRCEHMRKAWRWTWSHRKEPFGLKIGGLASCRRWRWSRKIYKQGVCPQPRGFSPLPLGDLLHSSQLLASFYCVLAALL